MIVGVLDDNIGCDAAEGELTLEVGALGLEDPEVDWLPLENKEDAVFQAEVAVS